MVLFMFLLLSLSKLMFIYFGWFFCYKVERIIVYIMLMELRGGWLIIWYMNVNNIFIWFLVLYVCYLYFSENWFVIVRN